MIPGIGIFDYNVVPSEASKLKISCIELFCLELVKTMLALEYFIIAVQ